MSNRICLGAIVGVHGIKGEVKIKSFTEVPEDIDQYGSLEDKSGTKKFDIKILGNSKNILRAKIKGVEDRNTSETLIGTELYVDRNLLPDVEDEEEFYYTDLIGLKVLTSNEQQTTDNASFGTVLAVHNFGAGDMLEIKLESGKSEMLPFTKAFVPNIDINNAIIISEAAVQFLKGDKEDES